MVKEPRKLPLALINSWSFTHEYLNPFLVKVKERENKSKNLSKVKVKSAEEAATGAN